MADSHILARKFRPQTFDQVIGQDPITRTLRNAVKNARVHHAYIFTGARGVGKTTTAHLVNTVRMLNRQAKKLNSLPARIYRRYVSLCEEVARPRRTDQDLI